MASERNECGLPGNESRAWTLNGRFCEAFKKKKHKKNGEVVLNTNHSETIPGLVWYSPNTCESQDCFWIGLLMSCLEAEVCVLCWQSAHGDLKKNFSVKNMSQMLIWNMASRERTHSPEPSWQLPSLCHPPWINFPTYEQMDKQTYLVFFLITIPINKMFAWDQ